VCLNYAFGSHPLGRRADLDCLSLGSALNYRANIPQLQISFTLQQLPILAHSENGRNGKWMGKRGSVRCPAYVLVRQ
jgi:hypothetical protein